MGELGDAIDGGWVRGGKIKWRVSLLEGHGVDQSFFCGGEVDWSLGLVM